MLDYATRLKRAVDEYKAFPLPAIKARVELDILRQEMKERQCTHTLSANQ